MYTHTDTRFLPLGADEDPTLGLFFLEHENRFHELTRLVKAGDEPSAAGIGWLVNNQGLVVTCAHVILILDQKPGATVSIFGASKSVFVEMEASVLETGWLGPLLDERRVNPVWQDIWDARPDTFREDIAFLQIHPDTVRWHSRSDRPLPTDKSARQVLFENARVLPFSAANYRRSGAELKAWCVRWYHAGPDCQTGDAQFRSVDMETHQAVRVSTHHITHGFSGSPLWDERRRSVVGIVRRALPEMGDLVLGTDPRAMTVHPQVAVTPDRRLRALISQLHARQEIRGANRYSDTTGVFEDSFYIEPEIDVSSWHDPLADVQAHDYRPATDYLIQNAGMSRNLLLRGGAGIGKSTLLRRVAAKLLSAVHCADNKRIVPFFLTARELADAGLDLGRCLENMWIGVRPADCLDEAVADVLAENAASLLVLVDGLDEIPPNHQRAILARLKHARRPGTKRSLYGVGDLEAVVDAVIIASRPADLLRFTPALDSSAAYATVDLCGFDESAIQAFCQARFESAEPRNAFIHSMKRVRWASGRVPPLQLQMAASLFEWDQALPERVVDLPARYVDHMVERAKAEFLAHDRGGILLNTEVTEIYLPHAIRILELAGAATLNLGGDRLTELDFQDALLKQAAAQDSPSWARNIGTLIPFMLNDFANFLAFVNPTRDESAAPGITWSHRTFIELLAAQHCFSIHSQDRAALESELRTRLDQGDHSGALTLLGVMDREHRADWVARALDECMRRPVQGSRPQLFAVRALAHGIDGGGRSREEQVGLLIRLMVSDFREAMLCRQVFSDVDDLPDAKDLLCYPELRADIFRAMTLRFALRIRRSTPRHPAVVLPREAHILEAAKLWPEFIDLGLTRLPNSVQNKHIRSQTTETLEEAAVGRAQIDMTDPNGSTHSVIVSVNDFVNALVMAARRTGPTTSNARLVQLAVSILQTAPHRES